MANTEPAVQGQVVGDGKTQLLCEVFVNIKPPMSKIISESYDVSVTDYTVFNDKVLVSGIVEKTFYYQHPHGKKGANDKDQESDNQEEKSKEQGEKSKEQGEKSKQQEENKNESAAPDEFKCLDSWGSLVDSYAGIVHFQHQIFEFTGTVEIPGVVPGDLCQVELAEVKEYDPFVAAEIENSGLIKSGRQLFKIDVALKVTRS